VPPIAPEPVDERELARAQEVSAFFTLANGINPRNEFSPMNAQPKLQKEIESLGPWFHNLELGGIETAPGHFLGNYPGDNWKRFAHVLPKDLSGRSVLDIGCNAGYYSLEMKRRGAARVVGVDSDPRYLAQARLASQITGLELELRQLSVYEVGTLGERFDLVLFMGVLYHLRHPLLALDLLFEHVVGDLLLFQSMLRGSSDVMKVEHDYSFGREDIFARPGFPRMHFIEHEFAGDWTNWWIPNRACVEAMLRSAGFEVLERPVDEVYLCRRGARRAVENADTDAALRAVGQSRRELREDA
jgi:tRNA (mo5U34)-methyltransferase